MTIKEKTMHSNDLEDIICLNSTQQKVLNDKLEEEIKKFNTSKKKAKNTVVTDIALVGERNLFGPKAIWKLTNLENLCEFEISGASVEFYLQGQPKLRKMLIEGEIDAFRRGQAYLKFCSASLEAQNVHSGAHCAASEKKARKNELL